MRDVPSLNFYVSPGREAVEEWLHFLKDYGQLMALVPWFQKGLSLEENVANFHEAATVKGVSWHQTAFLYSGDDALAVIFAKENQFEAFEKHLKATRERFNQQAYIWCRADIYILCEEDRRRVLPYTFAFGPVTRLERIDQLADHLIPGFKTEGQFNPSSSFVQMKDKRGKTT